MKKRLIIFSVDDWEGIYDQDSGRILTQGTRINLIDLLLKLGFKVETNYIPDDELDEFGNSFPSSLEKIEAYYNKKMLK